MPQLLFAQASTATVPDLTGLSVPEAAALLNRNGLRLGSENNGGWTADSGLPQNTISGQSVAAGQTVEAGTTVDVTVLRSPNALLLYDDNDLTLVNQTGGTLNLGSITFKALDGSGAAFSAGRWGGTLETGDCGQIWSVGRGQAKQLPECDVVLWLTTNNRAEHFWTGAGGTTRFAIAQNGVQRAECPVSNPGRCELFLASSGGASDATEYVYFAYTPEHLAVINNSSSQWMPLAGVITLNYFAPTKGSPVPLGDPGLYTRTGIPGSVERLAPGQCVLFTDSRPGSGDRSPQPCDVIARLDVATDLIFWGAEFGVRGVSDDLERKCPAAQAGRLIICVMPR